MEERENKIIFLGLQNTVALGGHLDFLRTYFIHINTYSLGKGENKKRWGERKIMNMCYWGSTLVGNVYPPLYSNALLLMSFLARESS